jgi:hypothetical protein
MQDGDFRAKQVIAVTQLGAHICVLLSADDFCQDQPGPVNTYFTPTTVTDLLSTRA